MTTTPSAKQEAAMTSLDSQLNRVAREVSALSDLAKEEGDLPTMYATNRAWRELFDAQTDRAKRALALSKEGKL